MANTIVCPKSGCIISSTPTSAVSSPVIASTGSSGSLARNDSIHAVETMNKGLRNSEGWSWNAPMPIHRRAPFTSTPMNGTASRSSRKIPLPISAKRRAAVTGSIETSTITGTESATQPSWRQK